MLGNNFTFGFFKYKLILKYLFIFSWCISFIDAKIKSEQCQPYFAAIKVSEANLRVGPGRNYKVIYKYITKWLPVLISAKYDHWRKIKDPDGTEGWLHKGQLSSKRYVISIRSCQLYELCNNDSKIIANIKKNVVMKLIESRPIWCYIEVIHNKRKIKGWIQKKDLFGILDSENSIY